MNSVINNRHKIALPGSELSPESVGPDKRGSQTSTEEHLSVEIKRGVEGLDETSTKILMLLTRYILSNEVKLPDLLGAAIYQQPVRSKKMQTTVGAVKSKDFFSTLRRIGALPYPAERPQGDEHENLREFLSLGPGSGALRIKKLQKALSYFATDPDMRARAQAYFESLQVQRAADEARMKAELNKKDDSASAQDPKPDRKEHNNVMKRDLGNKYNYDEEFPAEEEEVATPKQMKAKPETGKKNVPEEKKRPAPALAQEYEDDFQAAAKDEDNGSPKEIDIDETPAKKAGKQRTPVVLSKAPENKKAEGATPKETTKPAGEVEEEIAETIEHPASDEAAKLAASEYLASLTSKALVPPASAKDGLDAATGCVVGTLCADAMGAALKFAKAGEISEDRLTSSLALTMSGAHDLAPGQVTAAGEMTLGLLHALMDSGKNCFDAGKAARWLVNWFNSKPFDAGKAMPAVLCVAAKAKESDQARLLRTSAATVESNDSLMRISPLAVYLSRTEDDALFAKVVSSEVTFTHSSKTVQEASICYCIAIRELITHVGERERAYTAAKNWAMRNGGNDIKEWFADIDARSEMETWGNMDWTKIAFTHAFVFLLKGLRFHKAVELVVARGGNASSIAAVVGGLLGAAEGFISLPECKTRMLNCDTNRGGQPRPDEFSPAKCNVLEKVRELYAGRPGDGQIKATGAAADEGDIQASH